MKMTMNHQINKEDYKKPFCAYLPCSRITTSVQPRSARWYATDEPIIPPPQITTCACAGTRLELSAAAKDDDDVDNKRQQHGITAHLCGLSVVSLWTKSP